jgi:hypothetical protein
MKKSTKIMASAALADVARLACVAGLATLATAQPRIVSLGSGVPLSVSDNGQIVSGSQGSGGVRWSIVGGVVTLTPIAGSTGGGRISNDGSVGYASMANTSNLGGLGATASIAGRWTTSSVLTNMGLFAPNPSLNVTGSGNSSGSIYDARNISPEGNFIVGQGYISPANSFRFRGYVYNSTSNVMSVLATSFNSTANRYRDGRAVAVSGNGQVIVGGEDPGSSGSGRPIVYRFNSGTSTYDWSYLPDGIDPVSGNTYTRTVDNFYINAAGTLITGTSLEHNTTSGFADFWLTQWSWDGAAWNRALLHNISSTSPTLSSWYNNPNCSIPPNLIIGGVSDDGEVITGILVYSTCGSFIRGGFIYDRADGVLVDLYDYLVGAGTAGMSDYAPQGVNLPPRLGWANDISSDGRHLVGYGGPQSGFGPPWIINLDGGDCVPPFIITNPSNQSISRCSSFILNAAAGGTGPISFAWSKNGVPLGDGPTGNGSTLTGSSTGQLRITSISAADVGNYTCTMTNSCGSVTTTAGVASLDVNAPVVVNDTCATATVIGDGVTTYNACAAFNDDFFVANCNTTANSDVWFRYVPTQTREVRIETCASTYNTVLSAYSECGGAELACNDNVDIGPSTGCSSNRSRIGRLAVTAGVPVYLRIASSGNPTAVGSLNIYAAPPAVVNDSCSGALPVAIGTTVNFNTTEAVPDTVAACSTAQSRDVWYSVDVPPGGTLRAATCPGTTMNTVLSIYDSCFGLDIACNDNANVTGCSTQSIVTAPVSGGTYYIRVATNSATTFGTGVLSVDFLCIADFNQDGGVDGTDVEAFFLVWSTGAAAADVNNDGGVDGSDVEAFFGYWSAGGC